MALIKPINELTLSDRAYLLAICSLRPVQFLLAFAGLAASIGMTVAMAINLPTPLDRLINIVGYIPVLMCFYGYSLLSGWCSISLLRSNTVTQLKYIGSGLGVLLWSLCSIAAVKVIDGQITIGGGGYIMFFVPMFADVWILAQLMSGIRNVSRRG